MGVQIKIRPQVENRERFGRLVRPAVWNLTEAAGMMRIELRPSRMAAATWILGNFFPAISASTSLLKNPGRSFTRGKPLPLLFLPPPCDMHDTRDHLKKGVIVFLFVFLFFRERSGVSSVFTVVLGSSMPGNGACCLPAITNK